MSGYSRNLKILLALLGCVVVAAAYWGWHVRQNRVDYHDRFARNEANEWRSIGGAWQLSDGAVVNRSDERGAKLVSGSPSWKNYQLSAEIMLIGHGGDVGLIVRLTQPERGVDSYTGYYAGVRSVDSALVVGRADYGWMEGRPIPLQGGIHHGQWYRLRIVAFDCHIGAVATDESTGKQAYVAFEDQPCAQRGAIGLRSMGTGGAWRNITVAPATEADWIGLRDKAGFVEQPIYPIREADYNRMRDTYFNQMLTPSRVFALSGANPSDKTGADKQIVAIADSRKPQDAKDAITIRGVVTLTSSIYVQDPSGGIAVTLPGAMLNLGDEVELTGRTEVRDDMPVFHADSFRLLWDRTPVIPASITSTQAATGAFEATLVDVRGILLAKHMAPDGLITLDLTDAAQRFQAVVGGGLSLQSYEGWQPGSELRIRGICTMSPPLKQRSAQDNDALFTILLRSLDDVEILQDPPWWTGQRMVLLILVAVLVTILGVLLYTRLESAKHRAILDERERLAHEMHDTLAQSFAGVGFHLQGVRNSLESGTSGISDLMKKLNVACDLVTVTHREASASIAALHPESDGSLDLLVALERSTNAMLEGDGLPLTFEREGIERPMSMSVRDVLFKVGLEAITNVLRHSHATAAVLALHYKPHEVILEIRDNGNGFLRTSATPGFGIRTMYRRCEKIGATLDVTTSVEDGTAITVHAPYGLQPGLRVRLRTLVSMRSRERKQSRLS